MNIDDIKGIMDAFDPASLLPDIGTITGKIDLIARICVMLGPIVVLVLGLLYLFAAPKEANHSFGYRTWFGMGSVDAWRFTQRLAGIVLGTIGLVLTVVMFFMVSGFGGMEVMDLVWKAVKCLLWEIGAVVIACLGINITATVKFDGKGRSRKKNT